MNKILKLMELFSVVVAILLKYYYKIHLFQIKHISNTCTNTSGRDIKNYARPGICDSCL
jgi:hypothetical protein